MAKKNNTASPVTRVYVGPTLPGTLLTNAQIITGTEAEISAYLAEYTETYPELPYMLFAPSELAEAQKRAKTSGNILHKYYEDMAAKARVRKGR